MAEEIVKVRRSVPFKVDRTIENGGPGIGFAMFQWVVSGANEVPPYWSMGRDKWLRQFVYDNGPLKTAVNTFVNKVATIPLSVQAKDRSMMRHVRSAQMLEQSLRRNSGSMSSSPLKGFKQAFKMFTKDYLTQDNGAFMLVLGQGRADGPIVGPPSGLLHLDSACCVRTKDAEFPVKYHNIGLGGDSKDYKIHYTRLIEMVNLPSSEVVLNGVGLCAVSCCIEAAQELWDIYRYSQEMFGSRPPNQILYAKKGATTKNLNDMIEAWQIKLNNEQRHRFGGTMVAAPRMGNQELDLEILKLSVMPENYNRRDITTINKSEIAAAFGLDLRDLAYVLGAPSRTGDAEVQDRKGRGKGVGEFIETFVERFEEVYLNKEIHAVAFDYLDDEQDEQQATIRNFRSQARERDLRSGVTTIRAEREIMLNLGEISREVFEQMELLDGRLPEGLDVLLLFQSQDGDFSIWLDLGVSDPTNIAANDPQMMADAIHAKFVEVSEYVHGETNLTRRRKAFQALAALDKLRSMYQLPEGQMIDEQATLEAAANGGEQSRASFSQTEDGASKERREKDHGGRSSAKQISPDDPGLAVYEEEFRALVRYAAEMQMTRNEFEEAVALLVSATILALFLRGARKTEERLTEEEVDAINGQVANHLLAIAGLSADIYSGRYAPGELGLASAYQRISTWVSVAAGVYALGELYRSDDPFYTWRLGIAEHCTTCLRLAGQVHRASEWRAAGWWPRSWRLECRGIHCKCFWEEGAGPSSGGF